MLTQQDTMQQELSEAFGGVVESVHWSRKRRSAGPADVVTPHTASHPHSNAHSTNHTTGLSSKKPSSLHDLNHLACIYNISSVQNKSALKAALRAARPPKYFTGTVYIRLASADVAAAAVAHQIVSVRGVQHPVLPADGGYGCECGFGCGCGC